MKKVLFLGMITSALAAFSSAIVATLASPFVYLFHLAFPIENVPIPAENITGGLEPTGMRSQTGAGVWSFVTNLFKVEGRTYTWQGGGVA